MISINILIFRLNNLMQNKLMPDRERLGLSKGQPKVLRYLLDNGGCNQNDIAQAYDIKPATVSKLLDGLEANGHIKRVTGDDRRSFKIKLTTKGKEAYMLWEIARDKLMDKMLKDFSEEDKVKLREYLLKCLDNLKESDL